MFCPTCGRDNLKEQKFCVTCGTNLEAVSQVLFGTETNFFTRIDTGLDQFMARYAEHLFKNASSHVADRSVGNSWKLLGKGVLTSFMDLFMAIFLWNFFVFRFHVLWISTPFRLFSERSSRQKKVKARIDTDAPLSLPESPSEQWISGSAPSISEHTTERLKEYRIPSRESSREG